MFVDAVVTSHVRWELSHNKLPSLDPKHMPFKSRHSLDETFFEILQTAILSNASWVLNR